jgi:hypothetical protein
MHGYFSSLLLVALFTHYNLGILPDAKYMLLVLFSLLIPWVHKGMMFQWFSARIWFAQNTSPFSNDHLQSLGAEKDSLDIIQHDWALPKMERHAEDTLRKLLKKWCEQLGCCDALLHPAIFCCSLLVDNKVYTFRTVLFMIMTGSMMIFSWFSSTLVFWCFSRKM